MDYRQKKIKVFLKYHVFALLFCKKATFLYTYQQFFLKIVITKMAHVLITECKFI